ncbi:MAG TPA: glycosyltransferase [Gemmata sp.]|nr:glycosyltransferase [Gemmata sp.]
MISLVLPAYNPGPAIEETWLAVRQFLNARSGQSDPWEALFVLDGCTDGTNDRLHALAEANDPRIRIVSYPSNRGKGYAVRKGLLEAQGSIRIFTDVDLAYPFADILRVADAIRAGASVAIGSRAHPESRLELPSKILGYVYRRGLQGKLFGAIARLLLPISTNDSQAGLKGMTAAVAESLIPHLICDGFGFDCELLTACARVGVPLIEVPVCVHYDGKTSTTSPRSGVQMLRELWGIRRYWRKKNIQMIPIAAPSAPDAARTRPPAAA